MKKNDIYVILALIVSFVAVVLSGVLIDDNAIFHIDTIQILFILGILGSSSYSGIIMLDGCYFQLCFGMTRKKIYTKYIKDILTVLLIIVGYSLVFFFTKFMINKSIKTLLNLTKIIPYLEIFIFTNAISFLFGNIVKNKYLIIVLSIILEGLIIFNIHELLGYYNVLFLVIGILLYYFDYKVLINKKIE